MDASVGRNDPCPCGSGNKFKRCCLGKVPAQRRRRLLALPLTLAAAGIGAGIYLGMKHGLALGASVAGAGLILAGLIYVLRDPPPPTGKSDSAAAINFGGR